MDNTSFNNDIHLTSAELAAYSQGNLSNKEMHRLELHLISCEFCNEALEGVLQIREAGLHKSLANIKAKTETKSSIKINISKKQWMAMAASIALFAVVSAVFFFLPDREETSLADKSTIEESPELVEESLPGLKNQEDSLNLIAQREDSLLAIAETTSQQYAARRISASEVIEEEAIGLNVSDRQDELSDLTINPDTNFLADNIIGEIPEEAVAEEDMGAAARSKKIATPAVSGAETMALSKDKESKEEVSSYITATPEKGVRHYERYLKRSLKYPDAATENNIEGEVVLELSINSFGSVTNIDVKQSLGYGCDQEAIRLVREGPNWVAGTRDNVAIDDKVSVAIPFKLKD